MTNHINATYTRWNLCFIFWITLEVKKEVYLVHY